MTLPSLRNLTQIALVAVIFGVGAFLAPDWQIGTTPLSARHGWAGAEALEHSEEFIATAPPFQLVDSEGNRVVQDNSKRNVRHWEAIRKITGSIPKNVPQEDGDCTSQGTKNAVQGTQAMQIDAGKRHVYKSIYPPFTYRAARVWVLKNRIRGAGATGAAVAEASQTFGVLPSDTPGLPPYSGAIARSWGSSTPSPIGWKEEWKAEAAKYRVQTVARVRTAEEIRDAVCNGYGVIICSDWGAEGRSAFREQDGRVVASRRGSWSHCMCIDGYDGSASQPYWHVLNSWGPTASPAPIDDSPPGGFWIARKDMEYIARQGDSWAFSDFDGFPVQPLPNLFGRMEETRRPAVLKHRAVSKQVNLNERSTCLKCSVQRHVARCKSEMCSGSSRSCCSQKGPPAGNRLFGCAVVSAEWNAARPHRRFSQGRQNSARNVG